MTPGIHDIAFIGCGSVGRPLGRLLHEAGVPIRGVSCRSPESAAAACTFMGGGEPMPAAAEAAASARCVIIATPDRLIADADKETARGVGPGSVVLHLSGALPSSILTACRAAGAHVGSMHPLQSFTDPVKSLEIVAGSVFACEGDDAAVRAATEIAAAAGGRPVTIPTESKPLYHAAAAAASNFVSTVLCLSVDLMEKTGMDRKTALDALVPLIDGTVRNAQTRGLPDALTGPVERGDVETVRTHLEAIRAACPELEAKYAALLELTVDAALRKGSITADQAKALRGL
jgi:predicted short-subunit dehydrogenase-like oxidoreductase (DUF2520 family)